MEQKKLEDLTVVELKALVYDLLGQKQTVENNLQVVNNLIVTKQKQPQQEVKEEENKE